MPAVSYAANTHNVKHITGISAAHNFRDIAPSKAAFWAWENIICYGVFLGNILWSTTQILAGTMRSEAPDYSEAQSDIDIVLRSYGVPFDVIAGQLAQRKAHNTWDITAALQQLTSPLLLIYGSNDILIPEKAGSMIQKRTPAPCTIATIEGGTHALPTLRPSDVLLCMQQHGMK
jgi:fermentation-respiration switch protein FrsA (DUF1100 family)